MVSDETYGIHYCKKHKVTIYFFKKENKFTEYHCWDCLRDDPSKDKSNEKG